MNHSIQFKEKLSLQSIALGIGIGLLIGGIGGYILFANSLPVQLPHTPHPLLEVSTEYPIPKIAMNIEPDLMGGYNIELQTEHFRFAPENVNTPHVPNEGHAHLFVNGRKINRLYGNWYLLSANELEFGDNNIVVTLNANDHSELTYNGTHIQAEKMLTFPL